ncbi:MAG: hypothetical protein ACRCX2_38885 [Paraclostridium sp.]
MPKFDGLGIDDFIEDMAESRAYNINEYSQKCLHIMSSGEVTRFLQDDSYRDKQLKGVTAYTRQMESYDHYMYKTLSKMKKFMDKNQNSTFKKIDKMMSTLSIENKKFVEVATFVSTVARRFKDFNERTEGYLDNIKVYDLDTLNSLLLYGDKVVEVLRDLAVEYEEILQSDLTDPVAIKIKYDNVMAKYTDKSGKVIDMVQYISELEKFKNSDEVKSLMKDFKLHLVEKPMEVLEYIEDLGYISATEVDELFTKIKDLHSELGLVRKDLDKKNKQIISRLGYISNLESRSTNLNDIPTANAQGMIIDTLDILSMALSKMTSRYISVVQGITLLLGNAHDVSKEILNTEVFKQLRKGRLEL